MEKECKTCQKGIPNAPKGIIILSVFILFASVYGTIQIIKDITSLFTH
jgi:hypothetical protein